MLLQRIRVKALHNYEPPPGFPDLLSFKRHDIISNVTKDESGWWRGDLEEQVQKSFPSHFVEVLDETGNEDLFGDLQTGTVGIGHVEIIRNTQYDTKCPYQIQIYESPLPFRTAVETEAEAKRWQNAIHALLEDGQERPNVSY